MAEEKTQLKLIEEISTAVRDLAQTLGGGKQGAAADDIVKHVQACDRAGVILSSLARSECARAQCDVHVRCNKYGDLVSVLMEDSPDIASLTDTGMSLDNCTDFVQEQVERVSIDMLQAIPEEHTGKAAAKIKEEAAKLMMAWLAACGNEKFLGKGIKFQAEASSAPWACSTMLASESK